MTTAELLVLPNDGVERWLVGGQLRQARIPRPEKHARALDNAG
jgi:hypothetical protein